MRLADISAQAGRYNEAREHVIAERDRLHELMAEARRSGAYTVTEIAEAAGISRQQAQRDLRRRLERVYVEREAV